MNDNDYGDGGFDLREYFRVLRRRKWTFIAVMALAVIIAVGLSALERPTYSASSLVLIQPNLQSTVNPNTPQIESTDILARQLQDEVLFAEGDQVKSAVTRAVGHTVSGTITPQAAADALTFTTQAPTAAGAARDANAYADAYLRERRKSQTQNYLETSSVISAQINALRKRQKQFPPGDAESAGIAAAIGTLQSSLADLNASGELSRVGGDQINTASTPSSPVSPNYPRNIVIAAFLGAIIGLWLVFLIERSDERINTKEDLDAVSGGIGAIGLIPWAREWRNAREAYIVSDQNPESPPAEAFRALRTAVDLVVRDDQFRTIGVTSAGPAEGKSATVANLGVALARAGRRITLVDCDLRRPRLHEFFGVENTRGVVSVLTGECDLAEAVHEIADHPGLSLLTAGPETGIPSELLSGPKLQQILDALSESDLVLIDCAPVLPVTDAVEVAHKVQGMLLVVRAGQSHARSVRRMLEILQQVDVAIVGMILSGVRVGRGFDDTYYAYAYGTRGKGSDAMRSLSQLEERSEPHRLDVH